LFGTCSTISKIPIPGVRLIDALVAEVYRKGSNSTRESAFKTDMIIFFPATLENTVKSLKINNGASMKLVFIMTCIHNIFRYFIPIGKTQ